MLGFRLDTKVNQYDGKYYRYIRLIVRDWTNTLIWWKDVSYKR